MNGQDNVLAEESNNRLNTFVSTQHGEMRNGILSGLTASLNRRTDEFGYAPNSTHTRPTQAATFSGQSSGIAFTS